MVGVQGTRIGWSDVPAHVRDSIAGLLGAGIVDHAPQGGGFSPGAAERLLLSDGRRAFVKAANIALNEFTPGMYRREAEITASLPPQVPSTHLIACYDDGDWVALILADVDGRNPHVPWQKDELDAVIATLDQLAEELTPAPDIDVPTARESLELDAAGFRRLIEAGVSDLEPMVAAHLPELVQLADDSLVAITGKTLVHMDVRADNMLVRPDGTVVLVDWPHACIGAEWLDSLLLLVNVGVYGGHDIDALVTSTPVLARADPADLDAGLGLLASYFCHAWRQPPPPGLPTVRDWQNRQLEVVLPWLSRRRGWAS
jgi:Phosphotransferase enzyme family